MHTTSVATAVQLHLAQENQHQFTISLVISRSRGWCHVNWGIDFCNISVSSNLCVCLHAPLALACLLLCTVRLGAGLLLEERRANRWSQSVLGIGYDRWATIPVASLA